MDEFVIKYYRKLLRYGFLHSGCLENPSIFLDTVGEKIRICGHTHHNYLHLFINIKERRIDQIKYLCVCDPTANVVVEVLCVVAENKTLEEASALTPEIFCSEIGGGNEDFLKKARAILELFNRGLDRYNAVSSASR
jgi:hypothetical protein